METITVIGCKPTELPTNARRDEDRLEILHDDKDEVT